MVFPQLSFLFWGWFRIVLVYSLYGAVAAAICIITELGVFVWTGDVAAGAEWSGLTGIMTAWRRSLVTITATPTAPRRSTACRARSGTRAGCRRRVRAASRICSARRLNGTRYSRFALVRVAGTVHTCSSASISADRAPRTSPERAAVSTKNHIERVSCGFYW